MGSSPCRRPRCLLGSARQALPQLLPLQLLQQVLMLAQDHSAAQRAYVVGEGHPKPTVGPPVWTEPDARRRPTGVDGTGCPPRAEAEDVSLTRPLDPADDWSACQNPSKACVLLFSKDVSTVLNGSLKKKKKDGIGKEEEEEYVPEP